MTFDAEYLAVRQLQADALITIDPTLAAKAEEHRVARAVGDALDELSDGTASARGTRLRIDVRRESHSRWR